MLPALFSLVLLAQPIVPDGGTVVVKGKRFLAEVARTDREKALGLMRRQSLAHDRCMFFVYEEDGTHPIWMKNCLIALDVVWIKADGTVVEIKEHAPPCSPMLGDACPSYGGRMPSRYFVEFAAGTVRRQGLKVGERIGWELQLTDGRRLVGGAPVPKEGKAISKKKIKK
jgi:hypothetical protein